MEDRTEVHGDGGVHGLKDSSGAQEEGVFHCLHTFGGLYDGFACRVVAKDDAHFVVFEIGIIDACLLERFAGRHVRILCLIRHGMTHTTVEVWFEIRFGHYTREGGMKTYLCALGINAYTGTTRTQRVRHFGFVAA